MTTINYPPSYSNPYSGETIRFTGSSGEPFSGQASQYTDSFSSRTIQYTPPSLQVQPAFFSSTTMQYRDSFSGAIIQYAQPILQVQPAFSSSSTIQYGNPLSGRIIQYTQPSLQVQPTFSSNSTMQYRDSFSGAIIQYAQPSLQVQPTLSSSTLSPPISSSAMPISNLKKVPKKLHAPLPTSDIEKYAREKIDAGQIQYTQHASQRLKERGFTTVDVENVLKNGFGHGCKWITEQGHWSYTMTGQIASTKFINVIFTFDKSSLCVITAYELKEKLKV